MRLSGKTMLAMGSFMLLILATITARAEEMAGLTFSQALQKVIDTYPTLDIARLQVQQARQEMYKIESTLGWQLAAQGGVNHDVSMFGIPSDVADAFASLNRTLPSGDSLGVSGSYRYEDSSATISPLLPNPSERINLDLNYRMPFGQGRDNPQYVQGRVTAEATVLLQKANELNLREQLAKQTQELFYSAASVRAQFATAQSAVDRARRLKRYVAERLELGLAEEKDILQSDAQLQARLSDLRALQVIWEQQRTTLNRLMGRPWDAEFIPLLDSESVLISRSEPEPTLVKEAEANSPGLLSNQAVMIQNEANLQLRRDSRKDVFDVVVSVGGRTASGDNATGFVDENDLAGGVRLEYQQALDKRGLDAGIYQAQLNLQIARQDERKIRDDVRYSVTGLLSEIEANQLSLKSYQRRVISEEKKVDEALERYRIGREATDRLIQFENEMQVARLAREQDRIALERRLTNLSILLGRIWQTVEYDKGP
jgi:outer membrane protein TolC